MHSLMEMKIMALGILIVIASIIGITYGIIKKNYNVHACQDTKFDFLR